MKIPTLHGTIDRRILINYSVDREVLEKFLPAPFRPKLVDGRGMVGICLIRLKHIRLKGLPKAFGISSENGAHRIAVEWTENGETKEGVYIPRRDTSSKLNAFAGGRLFPGTHHLASFIVEEEDRNYSIQFTSEDGTFLSIHASETNHWNTDSVFDDLACASDFYKNGAIGYSPDQISSTYDGLELNTFEWQVMPLEVSAVRSSFFENTKIFPEGSVQFDNALLMKNIPHAWKSLKPLK